MKTSFTRRAEAFADALDHTAAHGSVAPGAVGAGVAPLVFLAQRLTAVPQAPVSGLRSAFRDQLMAQATVTLAPTAVVTAAAPAVQTTTALPAAPASAVHSATSALSAVVSSTAGQLTAGALAVAVAVTGTGVAADRSLPGDAFYGLKRFVERMQRAAAGSTLAEAHALADQASARLDELHRLLAEGPLDADTRATAERLVADLSSALDATFAQLASAGAVPADLVEQLTVIWNDLAELVGLLPPSLQATVLDVLASLNNRLGALVDGSSPISGVPHLPVPAMTPTAPVPTPTVPTPLPTPTSLPTSVPTTLPTTLPSTVPTAVPTTLPTVLPTAVPTGLPTAMPTALPNGIPTAMPSIAPPTPPPTEPLVELPIVGAVHLPRAVAVAPVTLPEAVVASRGRARAPGQAR